MAMPLDPKITPRAKCHHAIRHAFSAAIAEYAVKHPELLSDVRGLEATSYALVKLMDHVLAIVDEYEIKDRSK